MTAIVSRRSRGRGASAPADDGAGGICRAASHPTKRRRDAAAADDQRAVAEQHEAAAEDRAEEDRQERAGLDERVARDEFVLAQVLRQQRVLDRAEDRRVRAQTEERGEEQRNAAQPQSPGARAT